jgi:hypothetical protein
MNIKVDLVRDRLRAGWTIEKAISHPKRKYNKCYKYSI